MDSQIKTARIAGFTYLIVIITGILCLQYIPSKLKLPDEVTQFKAEIPAFLPLFKIGIVCEIICWTSFLVLPFILYKLFKPVNDFYAKIMVAFALVQVPISFVNLSNKFAVINLLSNSGYPKMYTEGQLHTHVKFYLDLYHDGNFVNHIFWGLWLLPFGYLVYRSGFIPKILGILLMAGCFGYLIDFFGTFLFPTYDQTFIPHYIMLPASLGEVGICLWLMIIGVKKKQSNNTLFN
ncbi:hypothetical protein CEY12_20325 [Chryseobacterium sp. T16E-39]|uniref:DUF4386 domain-containing protein n=1 Tax=Chryseobacterium sp. T16E-39 TaxID=2015076 RepID=UPI000B5B2958|nr:DUF4386 domain-containing protein [Chryseobacterium sp. T16E-39]ASK32286.1 hypothetical protein CEY12_20325 [Chryseobacterium sp. T16E-39]